MRPSNVAVARHERTTELIRERSEDNRRAGSRAEADRRMRAVRAFLRSRRRLTAPDPD